MRYCVFCGSNMGRRPAYEAAAKTLGAELAARNIGLVYGGASVGLMGTVADAALNAGGEVIGVLPQALKDKELAHPSLTELKIVGSMHERKATMAELSDGFVALPGGAGTLEETFEIWTWAQLGMHQKPVGLLNVEGFYDQLQAFLDHVAAEAFMKPIHRGLLMAAPDPASLIDALQTAEPVSVAKWIGKEET